MTWVEAGMSGALRQLNSPWMYSFPGIPSYTWGSNRGEPINYPHLPHPHVCCEEGRSLAQSSVLAAAGASLNSEGFGSRAANPGCCRPWGALRGSGPPPELCEPQTCL